ncbi:hypothetical protein [Alkalicoccus daliensis]|uniref:Uncharacterized protein n=1 Tax=Alkalicoccus daliensis TaxID=745820 RepID=A0A1H0CP42_9BACI|nr:hypothetical protein [Alkalicoccus daliensis]SDN59603.1 hypothetical protein SAMN04488053_102174 [Alkalicoccus daliensis]
MKKIRGSAGFIAASLLIVGCQNAEETEEGNAAPAEGSVAEDRELNENEDVERKDESNENIEADAAAEDNKGAENSGNEENVSSNTEDDGDENTEEASGNNDSGNNGEAAAEIQETSGYFIDTNTLEEEVDGIVQFYTAISFARAEEEQLPLEEQIEQSLTDGDPTEQEILRSYADISTDGPALDLQFQEDGNQLSTTTAQSGLFYTSLFTISDLYGMEEISFFNPEEELDIIVAERGIQEPLNVQEERDMTRGYYTVYDEELEETLFLAGGEVEEQITNEAEDPLNFPETIETMTAVEREDAFYSSAMAEGIEVTQVMLEDGNAAVNYTMEEESVSEADRIVFEKAVQLAALDFHAEEIILINETKEERIIYPLIEQ